ncbi:MAG: hypothetical protein ACPGU9_03850 [Flavobacteriaceae bacterium]
MPKLYAQGSKKMNRLQPKKETINLILNYSKAMRILQVGEMQVEVHQN